MTNKEVEVKFKASISKIVDLKENDVINSKEAKTLLGKFDKGDLIDSLLEDNEEDEDDNLYDLDNEEEDEDDEDDEDDDEYLDKESEPEPTTLSIQEDKKKEIKDTKVKEVKIPVPKKETLPSGNTITTKAEDEDDELDFLD